MIYTSLCLLVDICCPVASKQQCERVRGLSIMELPITHVADCELRSVIRFLTAKNEEVSNIHTELESVYGHGCMSLAMVRRWHTAFINGRENVHDENRSGRPASVRGDDTTIVAVREIVDSNRRVTLDEILEQLPPVFEISRTSVQRILTENLGYSKVCSRWVPRLLTDAHKQNRIDAAQCFLELFKSEGDAIFSRIVTGDETWVHYSNPEKKNRVWYGRLQARKLREKLSEVSLRAKLWPQSFETKKESYW